MFEYKIERINTAKNRSSTVRPWSGWLGAGVSGARFRRRAYPEGLLEASHRLERLKPN